MTATPSPESLAEALESLSEQPHDVAGAQDDIRAAAALIRELVRREKDLRGLLEGVLLDAECGAYLRDRCSYEYGGGYTQPRELTISWEWQQSKPDTGGWGALQLEIDAWLGELREEETDAPIIRARSALEPK